MAECYVRCPDDETDDDRAGTILKRMILARLTISTIILGWLNESRLIVHTVIAIHRVLNNGYMISTRDIVTQRHARQLDPTWMLPLR